MVAAINAAESAGLSFFIVGTITKVGPPGIHLHESKRVPAPSPAVFVENPPNPDPGPTSATESEYPIHIL